MLSTTHVLASVALLISSSFAQAPSCSSTLTPKNAAPSVAPGYAAVLVANGLTKPRGIKFDPSGNLLVVEQGKGVSVLNVADNGGNCPQSTNKKTVVTDSTLNHGIELQTNSSGTFLYASSTEAVYRWAYAPDSQTNTSAPLIVVNNMTGTDHTTRTLLFSKKDPSTLLVTRGSLENLDPLAAYKPNAISQIKSFDLDNGAFPIEYSHNGDLLGWGMRNDVGIDEHPSGDIYSVENSADEITRGGTDIHQDNPGEKLNYLGRINTQGAVSNQIQEPDYGYPYCFAAWDPSVIPNFNGTVGQQFAIDGPNDVTLNDTYCQSLVAPRLTFQAHMAPLDILFNTAGTAAWVTFHGSWDRSSPVGYKLSVIEFTTDGQPTDQSTSKTAAIDIVTNKDNSQCPDKCFRPVGLAWDSKGRLFMSSDATGEIYAIVRTDGNATSSAGSNSTSSLPSPTAYSSTSPASGTASPAASSGTTTGAASSTMSTSIGMISTSATALASTSTSALASTSSFTSIYTSIATSAPVISEPATTSMAVTSIAVSTTAPTVSHATVVYHSQPPCHGPPEHPPFPGGWNPYHWGPHENPHPTTRQT